MKNKLEKPKLELEDTLRGLNESQLTRFQLLFAQKKNANWLLPTAFTALAVYSLTASILLHPGYSWLVVLIPTLFVIFFIRSLLKGVVTDAKKDHQKDYGSVILPFVLISLFGLCGVLVWARNENSREHQEYLKSYQSCEQDPDGTVVDSGYYYGYYDDCDSLLNDSRHERRVSDYDRRQDQLTRGVIVTGLGLLIIYPLSLYYSKSLIDKKNTLLAQALAEKIKKD